MGNSLSAREAFDLADTDEDGELDFNEIFSAATKMGQDVDETTVRKWIDDNDTDHNERLNREEFAKLMGKLTAMGKLTGTVALEGGAPAGIAKPPNVRLEIVNAGPGHDLTESSCWGRRVARKEGSKRDDDEELEDADDELLIDARARTEEAADDSQGGIMTSALEVPPPPPPSMLLSLLLLSMQKLGMVLSVPAAIKMLPDLWVRWFGWLAFMNMDLNVYIPDVPNAAAWSFVGQLSMLPAVTMLFATSVRTGATAEPSVRDRRYMQKLTPHGAVVLSCACLCLRRYVVCVLLCVLTKGLPISRKSAKEHDKRRHYDRHGDRPLSVCHSKERKPRQKHERNRRESVIRI